MAEQTSDAAPARAVPSAAGVVVVDGEASAAHLMLRALADGAAALLGGVEARQLVGGQSVAAVAGVGRSVGSGGAAARVLGAEVGSGEGRLDGGVLAVDALASETASRLAAGGVVPAVGLAALIRAEHRRTAGGSGTGVVERGAAAAAG